MSQDVVFDHFFCFVEPGLPAWKDSVEGCFTLDGGRRHPGQGTANRCVVLEENYLEFIWVEDPAQAEQNMLRLLPRCRWAETGASPFGIGLRGALAPERRRDYAAYRPEWAPGMTIWVWQASLDRPGLPFLFIVETPPEMLAESRPARRRAAEPGLMRHPCGARAIRSIAIGGVDGAALPPECPGLVSLTPGGRRGARLGLAGGPARALELPPLLTIQVAP